MDVVQLFLGLLTGIVTGSVFVAAFVIPIKLAEIVSALHAISRQLESGRLDKLDRDRQL